MKRSNRKSLLKRKSLRKKSVRRSRFRFRFRFRFKSKKECPPGKIRNPKSGICVNENGKIGKEIKEGKLKSKSKRKSKSKSLESKSKSKSQEKKCPKDKILNPETDRCVNKNGKIGKQILDKKSKRKSKRKSKSKSQEKKLKSKSPKKSQEKKCPKGKILNPETDRCVNENGKIGKEIKEGKLNNKSEKKSLKKDILGKLPKFNKKLKIFNLESKYFSETLTPPKFDLIKVKTGSIKDIKVTSSPEALYVCMVYLRNKYNNLICIEDLTHIKENFSKGKIIKWSDIGILFNNEEPLKINQTVIDSIKKCEKRFVLIPLGFDWKRHNKFFSHANMIIYDKKTNEVERFEPHGISGDLDALNMGEQFDNIFPKVLINLGIPVSKYYKPLDFCPRISFQNLEDFYDKLPSDPGGFCQTWTIWYADLRFANPNVSRKNVVQVALRQLKREPKGFKHFIRNYAKFIYLLLIPKKSK